MQSIIEDCSIWMGVIVPIIFLIYYTWLAHWWRNATGRAIVALDLSLLLILAPVTANLVDPGVLERTTHGWVVTVGLILVPVVILYRLAAFEGVRRHRHRWSEFERDVSRQSLLGRTDQNGGTL